LSRIFAIFHSYRRTVAYPGIFSGGGQQIQLRTEVRHCLRTHSTGFIGYERRGRLMVVGYIY